jgi:hypothetical protein
MFFITVNLPEKVTTISDILTMENWVQISEETISKRKVPVTWVFLYA